MFALAFVVALQHVPIAVQMHFEGETTNDVSPPILRPRP
jgi:hypothetical protein